MVYLTTEKNILLSRMIVLTAIATCTITSITTIIGLNIYPHAARDLAGANVLDVYYRKNIGGYGFIYTLVLFIPILLYAYKNMTFSFLKICFSIIIFLFYICIFKSQYTIAAILSLCMLIFLRKKTSKYWFLFYLHSYNYYFYNTI